MILYYSFSTSSSNVHHPRENGFSFSCSFIKPFNGLECPARVFSVSIPFPTINTREREARRKYRCIILEHLMYTLTFTSVPSKSKERFKYQMALLVQLLLGMLSARNERFSTSSIFMLHKEVILSYPFSKSHFSMFCHGLIYTRLI